MRKAFEIQGRFDCPAIQDVQLNHNCRDEIIPILEALKYIHNRSTLREKILDLIAQDVNGKTNRNRGRPGMDYWQIMVLSAVRLGCDLDYDKLQDLAEQHQALRGIMGIGDWTLKQFDWRRINENLLHVKSETMREISQLVGLAGHQLLPEAAKAVRGDSFVVETNIHYPTESSLIGDGLRKILKLAPELAELLNAKGWRQHKYLQKKCKKALRKINKITASKGKGYQAKLKGAYKSLLQMAKNILKKAEELKKTALHHLQSCPWSMDGVEALNKQMQYFMEGTEQVCDLANRRVFQGEKIPVEEKLFSLFEPHTELINRGKTPNPIEFGHRIFVLEDAAGFIIYHKVMAKGEQDRDVVIPAMKQVQEQLGGKIKRASFDRGFHSPENQRDLQIIVEHPCIAAKGKHKEEQQEKQATVEFRRARKSHPGIESAIGALQRGNGMKRCRDRHYTGYERYVALGCLGRNLHKLGQLLISQANDEAIAGKSKRQSIAV